MMDPSVDPAQTAKALLAELRDSGDGAGLHSRAALIDPTRWEAAIFTLGLDRSIEAGLTTYSVLHLSAPGLRDLQN